MTAILSVEPWRAWPPEIKSETVATYGGDGNGRSAFRVVHHRRLFQPWGLFVVYAEGEAIGRLLSFPSYADCLTLLEAFERGRAALAFAADRRAYSQGRRRRTRRPGKSGMQFVSASHEAGDALTAS